MSDATAWSDTIHEHDTAGNLTPLAMALNALVDEGCDCGNDEPGTCLECLCEAALRDLWEQLRECHERERRLLEATETIEAQRNMTMLPLPSTIRERAEAHGAILEAARRRRDSDNPTKEAKSSAKGK